MAKEFNQKLNQLQIYKNRYNNRVVNIVSFVNGTKGKFKTLQFKCVCGQTYIMDEKELVNFYGIDYSVFRCEDCEVEEKDYSSYYPTEAEINKAHQMRIDLEENTQQLAEVNNKLKELKKDEQKVLDTEIIGESDSKHTLLKEDYIFYKKQYRIDFKDVNVRQKIRWSKITWIEEFYNLPKHLQRKNHSWLVAKCVCPCCFEKFETNTSRLYGRQICFLSEKSNSGVGVCESCASLLGDVKSDAQKDLFSKIVFNLEHPLMAKPIINYPALTLDVGLVKINKDNKHNRGNCFITKLSDVFDSFNNPSNNYGHIQRYRRAGIICPVCNKEEIQLAHVLSKRISTGILMSCARCNAITPIETKRNFFEKAKIKYTENFLKTYIPTAHLNPNNEFDRGFYQTLIDHPELIEIEKYLLGEKEYQKNKGSIHNEPKGDTLIPEAIEEIKKETEEPVQSVSKTEEILKKLEQTLNGEKKESINNSEETGNYNISSIFYQIITDPMLKTLILEKLSNRLADEYSNQILHNDNIRKGIE